MGFYHILGLNHILDKVTLGTFCQFFHHGWVILAHLRKSDASQNCWRLLSAIFKRARINNQNRITSRKMKAGQFLWNQKWFQAKKFSHLVKPKLVSQIHRHFGGIFFLWLGFKDLKLGYFWLKITISGVSNHRSNTKIYRTNCKMLSKHIFYF